MGRKKKKKKKKKSVQSYNGRFAGPLKILSSAEYLYFFRVKNIYVESESLWNFAIRVLTLTIYFTFLKNYINNQQLDGWPALGAVLNGPASPLTVSGEKNV